MSGKYYVVPIEGLTSHRCKIVGRNDDVVKTPNLGYVNDPIQGEQSIPEGLPDLVAEVRTCKNQSQPQDRMFHFNADHAQK